MLDCCKKTRKNTNLDSLIHKNLCGFGKGTKCFKFIAYHATRKFRKVAIKTKLNEVPKNPSHFTIFYISMGCLGPSLVTSLIMKICSQFLKAEHIQCPFFTYTKYAGKLNGERVPSWIESYFQLPFLSLCRNWESVFLVSIKAFHQGSAFNSTWMNEYFFFIWKDMARNP